MGTSHKGATISTGARGKGPEEQIHNEQGEGKSVNLDYTKNKKSIDIIINW
jgi:hypothetical protein